MKEQEKISLKTINLLYFKYNNTHSYIFSLMASKTGNSINIKILK